MNPSSARLRWLRDRTRLARLEALRLLRRPSRPLPGEVLAADPPRSRRGVPAALLEERSRDR